jgi:uncharacterized protein (DUF169 family)
MADQRAQIMEMASRIGQGVATALEGAIGGATVVCGIAAVDGNVARCMVLCEGGFLLLELTQSGEQLCVVVPTWRVRRVTETRLGGVTRVQVELDADRSVMAPQPDGTTLVLASSYEVAQPTGADADVLRFAAAMRSSLLMA